MWLRYSLFVALSLGILVVNAVFMSRRTSPPKDAIREEAAKPFDAKVPGESLPQGASRIVSKQNIDLPDAAGATNLMSPDENPFEDAAAKPPSKPHLTARSAPKSPDDNPFADTTPKAPSGRRAGGLAHPQSRDRDPFQESTRSADRPPAREPFTPKRPHEALPDPPAKTLGDMKCLFQDTIPIEGVTVMLNAIWRMPSEAADAAIPAIQAAKNTASGEGRLAAALLLAVAQERSGKRDKALEQYRLLATANKDTPYGASAAFRMAILDPGSVKAPRKVLTEQPSADGWFLRPQGWVWSNNHQVALETLGIVFHWWECVGCFILGAVLGPLGWAWWLLAVCNRWWSLVLFLLVGTILGSVLLGCPESWHPRYHHTLWVGFVVGVAVTPALWRHASRVAQLRSREE